MGGDFEPPAPLKGSRLNRTQRAHSGAGRPGQDRRLPRGRERTRVGRRARGTRDKDRAALLRDLGRSAPPHAKLTPGAATAAAALGSSNGQRRPSASKRRRRKGAGAEGGGRKSLLQREPLNLRKKKNRELLGGRGGQHSRRNQGPLTVTVCARDPSRRGPLFQRTGGGYTNEALATDVGG